MENNVHLYGVIGGKAEVPPIKDKRWERLNLLDDINNFGHARRMSMEATMSKREKIYL